SAAKELTAIELRESFRIVRACRLAHGIREAPSVETMLRFFGSIFHSWDGGLSMPIEMPPVETPPMSRVNGQRSREEVATCFAALKGEEEVIKIYFRVEINHRNKTTNTFLCDKHNHVFTGDRESLHWRPQIVVDHLQWETFATLCGRLDARFLAYNEKRALRYIRNIIAANVHGQDFPTRFLTDGQYVFAGSASYIRGHFPLLWSYSSYRPEMPEMWLSCCSGRLANGSD
ncbi:hypothetical protein CP533_0012, partial [Ophiocordyceps camponoti-saundersi (nom. inval.)]